MITQKQIKKLISYNPVDGIVTFTRTGKQNDKALQRGYRRITIMGRLYLEHRIVWLYFYGEFPNGQVDHINSVRNDNRIENLRDVNNQENHKNKTLLSNNKSGITGVGWCGDRMKFRVNITVNLKYIHLGYFSSFFDACCSRLSAQLKFGFHENHGRGKKYKARKYPLDKDM